MRHSGAIFPLVLGNVYVWISKVFSVDGSVRLKGAVSKNWQPVDSYKIQMEAACHSCNSCRVLASCHISNIHVCGSQCYSLWCYIDSLFKYWWIYFDLHISWSGYNECFYNGVASDTHNDEPTKWKTSWWTLWRLELLKRQTVPCRAGGDQTQS